jgi:hypothetical protein
VTRTAADLTKLGDECLDLEAELGFDDRYSLRQLELLETLRFE